MSTRKPHVVFETLGNSPPIRGKYQVYVTPWSSYLGIIENYMDALEPGEPASLRFTVFEWTPDEFAEFCEQGGIDWEGD